jgi:hypothetical protein
LVELRARAANCLAVMPWGLDLEEFNVRSWEDIVDTLQAGTFREIQLLFANAPLVGDRLVRTALDVIT